MRAKIAQLGNSRVVLITLVTLVGLALAGTLIGYQTQAKAVTLSLDGQAEQVDARGETVGEVLASQDIEVTDHDIVAPAVDQEVRDGDRITVRFGRPLELSVDGQAKTYWVNSTKVSSALSEIGKRYAGADLSTSRGATIDREGMLLEVVTPKKVKVEVGGDKPVTRTVAALTVEDLLDELKVKADKDDIVKPGLQKRIGDGDKVVVTKMRYVTKKVNAEAIDHETVEHSDDSMYEGESEVVQEGVDGSRNVTYKYTYKNGKLVATKVLSSKTLKDPVDEIVNVGTKEEPAPDYSGGGTVWDALAQCESGGNWAINTGNGYYGGLQFNIGTWQAYGGSGLPSDNSREEQIRIAEKVRAATGGYGSWPACSASLGLPQ